MVNRLYLLTPFSPFNLLSPFLLPFHLLSPVVQQCATGNSVNSCSSDLEHVNAIIASYWERNVRMLGGSERIGGATWG